MKHDVKLLMLAILASSGTSQAVTKSLEIAQAEKITMKKETFRRIYPQVPSDYENYAEWPYANAADIPYENYGEPN